MMRTETRIVLLLLLLATATPSGAAPAAAAPDYILLKRCTATMDERVPTPGGTWQIGVPFVSIQLANGTGGWPARHTFEFDTYAFCNGPNGYPEYGTGDDICLGRAATLPGTLVYSSPVQAPDAVSGIRSLTDSPSGNSSGNVSVILNPSFNLTGFIVVSLIYFHHHHMGWESLGEIGFVEVSVNGGTTWASVKTHSNNLGDKGQFKRGEINLTPFIGQTIKIRFRLDSQGYDGWFLDDVRLVADGTTLFFDDFESGLGNWTPGAWGLSLTNYSFESLGTINGSGVYSTTPVVNPVTIGEGMGFAVVSAAYTEGATTRVAHAQVYHTAPQFKAATELGYDNLCPLVGACAATAIAGAGAPSRHVILEQNRPNPFNPSTDIRFLLPEPSRVSLRIYDESGRLARILLDELAVPAGEHGLSWNGLDAGGQPAPSGVYFYELRVNGQEHIRRMVLVK